MLQGGGRERGIEDFTQALQVIGSQQMEMDQTVGVQLGITSSSEVNLIGGEGSPIALKLEPTRAKSNKSSIHLGLHQKVIKKNAMEKNSKVGRKKDLDKIKLMGENLVESGLVKTLDSHFSNPPK